MDSVNETITSSMEWMKKQFTKPSYCNVDADKTNGAFGAGTKADEEDGFEEKTDHLPIAVPEKESAPKVSQPEEEYYCTIKMQDPTEVYSYQQEEPIYFPPCPPKTYKQDPRDPTCSCDLCKKNNSNRKCCETKKPIFDPNKKVGKLEHA